jgi:hypothetical protein
MTHTATLCVLAGFVALASVGCSSSDDTGKSSDYVAPTGDPITSDAMKWTWVEVPGTKCRDGSTAGIVVNKNPASDKLMIFLEGGGACYNQFTCGVNPASYDSSTAGATGGGILDRTDGNPVKDWNMVYVPFCTGDVFGGSKEGATIPGVAGTQDFDGYKNLDAFLERIVPTFPDVTRVVHTGVSAGGFGSALTADLVTRKFPPSTDIVLIDDSGPGMTKDYVSECLQKGWREAWNFDGTFLKDCGADCPNKDDYSINWVEHLVKAHPNARSGLISSTKDQVITLFYGYGSNNCAADPALPAPPLTGDVYTAGLMDFRQRIQSKTDKFATYYVDEVQHTYLHTADFYAREVNGVKLSTWVGNIIDGTSIAEVGP